MYKIFDGEINLSKFWQFCQYEEFREKSIFYREQVFVKKINEAMRGI